MRPKRPHASEGHLRLPSEPTSPARPSGDTRTVPVRGDDLAAYDIVAGDQVIPAQRTAIEHGERVGHREADGELTWWKAFPERSRLRLKNGSGQRDVASDTAFEGVVVAVVRQFRS